MITETMPFTPELGVSEAPGKAVTRLAMRQVRRGGLIVLGLTAGMPAPVVSTYPSVMADPAAAGSIAELAANPAIRTLFGEPVALDQAGGFTVWRVGTFLAVLLAAWAILATTRITRGEEDAGRWDVLLAGRVPLRAVVARHLAAVMIAPPAVGCAATTVLLLAGTDPAGAAVHGAGIGLLGLFFVAVAGLAAQAFAARASATGAAVTVLGTGLLMRMIGDGLTALAGSPPATGGFLLLVTADSVGAPAWIRQISPFGHLAPVPLTAVDWTVTLIMTGLAVALVVVGAAGYQRRDLQG